MGKVIRPRYSVEFSVGILLLIFVLAFFLSFQIFEIPGPALNDGKNIYVGTVLVSIAVIIMLLVLWEEFLFPVKIKSEEGGIVFRNHRNKLKTQLLIYCTIPIIFGFIYFQYQVHLIRFLIWATICIIAPVAGKLISGIKNYNDFLKLSGDAIEYRNNEKAGTISIAELQYIVLMKDERKVLHKVQLVVVNSNSVTIDLDEMELDEFIDAIDKFINIRYKNLIREQISIDIQEGKQNSTDDKSFLA